jgi:hypothetical protein
MKQAFFLTAISISIFSCGSKWSNEEQQAFTEACLEMEAKRGTPKLKAEAYCECALRKTSQQFANLTEAVESNDTADLAQQLVICRRSTQ